MTTPHIDDTSSIREWAFNTIKGMKKSTKCVAVALLALGGIPGIIFGSVYLLYHLKDRHISKISPKSEPITTIAKEHLLSLEKEFPPKPEETHKEVKEELPPQITINDLNLQIELLPAWAKTVAEGFTTEKGFSQETLLTIGDRWCQACNTAERPPKQVSSFWKSIDELPPEILDDSKKTLLKTKVPNFIEALPALNLVKDKNILTVLAKGVLKKTESMSNSLPDGPLKQTLKLLPKEDLSDEALAAITQLLFQAFDYFENPLDAYTAFWNSVQKLPSDVLSNEEKIAFEKNIPVPPKK
jgi:hypothetical protein